MSVVRSIVPRTDIRLAQQDFDMYCAGSRSGPLEVAASQACRSFTADSNWKLGRKGIFNNVGRY